MKSSNLRLLRALLAAPVVFALPAMVKADAASAVRSGVAEVNAESKEAALDYINARIDHLEDAADNAPAADKAALEARIDALEERRNELRKSYTKARYEELKADVDNEWEKAKSWTKDKTARLSNDADHAARETRREANRVGDNVRREASDVAASARSAVNPTANAVVSNLALYQMNPSDQNKEEVKAALKALDEELDRREDAIDDMPKGPARESEEKFLKDLRNRESELKKSFVKARWDTLVGDMKARWHRMTN